MENPKNWRALGQFLWKIAISPIPVYLTPPWNWITPDGLKNCKEGYWGRKKFDDIFSSLDTKSYSSSNASMDAG